MTNTHEVNEETSRDAAYIINEYREKLAQSLEDELSHMKKRAEIESRSIVAQAYQEATDTVATAKQDAGQIVEGATQQANMIITQAELAAAQVMAVAKEEAKKAAFKEKEKYVKDLLQKAQEEARNVKAAANEDARKAGEKVVSDAKLEVEKILERAEKLKQEAQRDMEVIKSEARNEAERIRNEEKESVRKELEEETSKILEEAKTNAQIERRQIIERTVDYARHTAEADVSQILAKAKERARAILAETSRKMQQELKNMATLISEIKQNLGQIAEIAEKPAKTDEQNSELLTRSTTVEELKKYLDEINAEIDVTNDNIAQHDDMTNYEGMVQVEILPPMDRESLRSLDKRLSKIGHVRVSTLSGDVKGRNWISFEITKPLPLINTLLKMPEVESVLKNGKRLGLILRAR